MKAVYLDKPGDADVLIYGDLPDGSPGRGQVLVKVEAISLNHVETVVRSGIRPYFKITPPHILGGELAGTIAGLGEGVSGFAVGDRVVSTAQGSYAELAIAGVDATFHLPDSVSFEDGAALGSTGPTAYRMVVRRARVAAGEDVLVTAAASGTGAFILQLANVAGARVIATAGSVEKRKLLEDLGAFATIDRYNEDVAARIGELTDGRGIDAAIDAISSQTMFDAITTSLRPAGRLVTYGNMASSEVTLNIRTLFSKGIELRGGQGSDPLFAAAERLSDMRAVLSLVGQGKVRPLIGRVMPLADTAEAHQMLEHHEVAGKIILIP